MRTLFDGSAFLRFDHLLGHPVKFLQDDGLATHSSHERDDKWALLTLVERRADLSIQRTSTAHAAETHVGLDNANHLELTEGILQAIGWVGPDGAQPYEADFRTPVAHMLNRVARRHRVPALYEKDDVGAIGHELFNPRVVASTEDPRELVMGLFNDRHRTFHGARTLQLERWALLGHDLRTMRHRMPRIERGRVFVRRQEFLYLGWVGQVDLAGDMSHEETILAHHLRQQYAPVLTDATGQQMIVEGSLIVT